MFQVPDIAIDHLKDVPGFKGLLKAVIKSQIQLLLEQLAKHTNEESIIMSACTTDGVFSHMASETARDFLSDREELKSQFLRHCLKAHHRCKTQVQDLERDHTGVNNETSHVLFRERMDTALHQNDWGNYTCDSASVSKPNRHVETSEQFHTTEVSRRKRLKITPPKKYHQRPICSMPSAYSDVNTSSNMDVGNDGTEHSSINMENIPENNDDSAVLNCSKVPVKIEIDFENDTEEVMAMKETSIQDMEDSKSREENIISFNNLSHTDALPKDLSTTGSVYNDDGVVDLRIIAANNSSSGYDESNSLAASQNFTQCLPVPDESQRVINASIFDSTGEMKIPKKRVYRKVECDICHKMIYITNIKVHKFRHLQNMGKSAAHEVGKHILPKS